MSETVFSVTPRTRVLRLAKRGHYDRETVYSVVDDALICHVAYVIDGQPHVLPTLIARDDDTVLLHGHGTNRTLLHAGSGEPVCINVTHTDGIVIARSIFNHSINYRSASLYGVGRLLTERDEKMDALYRFSEKMLPGRWDEVRQMTEQEFKGTSVIAVEIEDAVAKIRTGMPADEPEDLSWPTWAGVIPVTTVYGNPIPDEHATLDQDIAPSVATFMATHRPE